jgi:hypothetical protein
MSNARKPKPRWKLADPPKIRPLDPGKPLMPYRVPPLKAFDRCMPGQGQFDFGSDDPDAIVYPEDRETTTTERTAP